VGLTPLGFGGRSFVVAFLSDISERRRQEEALRASEARYRGLVEGSIQGILIHDRGRVLLVNAALGRLLGEPDPEALRGRSMFEFLPEEERERVRGFMEARARGEPAPPVYRLQALHRDGHRIWLEAIVSVVDWAGSPAMLVTLHDVTEQQRLELQMRVAQRSEALSRVARGVAHDFNNLLSVIAAYSTALREELDPSDPHREDVDAIRMACGRAEQLARQLMQLGRREESGTRPLSINGVVKGIEGLLRPIVGRSIALELRLAPEVGLVHADPSSLEQVVMNLAVNARDAMPGGGTLRVATHEVELGPAEVERHLGARRGRYVRLDVCDDGTGIDPEIQARLFEPFFTTKPPGQGTGLGLAIVDGVVRECGGFVAVESAPGKGTCFHVHLPPAA
jgi:PAS domain S-box-containing protein